MFLSYCSLHGSHGGGLASVRMELILLLQESHQVIKTCTDAHLKASHRQGVTIFLRQLSWSGSVAATTKLKKTNTFLELITCLSKFKMLM